MKDILAIAVSDIHLHRWKIFNEDNRRTMAAFNFLKHLKEKYPDTPLLFSGDLFQGEVGPILLTLAIKNWPYNKDNFFGVSGNHDQEEKSTIDNPTTSMVTFFDSIGLLTSLDFNSNLINNNTRVWGIPYLTYNKGFVETIKDFETKLDPHFNNILLIHTDLHGALDTDGREVGSVENLPKELGKLFKSFDLVLSGHIHKPQEIIPGVVMIGSPYEQRKSDSESVLGYWEIYKDFTCKFKPYRKAPRFRFYDEDELPGNDFDFWIKVKKEVLNDLTNSSGESEDFSNVDNITKMAKAYLEVVGVKKVMRKRALINALKEASNDTL